MRILRPIEWGFPFTLSRNTDIPTFHMRRFFEWKDRGFINAPHPQTGLPAKWSLAPKDVHSLVWWSKDYRPFLTHPRIGEIDSYRNYFCMTITGDRIREPKVPNLSIQIENFTQMVERYGAEKMQWRYSPVPLDTQKFREIAEHVHSLGVRECYFSFLHTDDPRSKEQRREILRSLCLILAPLEMTLLGCWDDEAFQGVAPNFGAATCVDAYKIDQIYGIDKLGIKHLKTPECKCSMSVEVATQTLLPCPHACSYCYASEKV